MSRLKRWISLMLVGGAATAIVHSLLAYLILGLSLWLTEDIYQMIRLLLPSMLIVGAVTGLFSQRDANKKNGCIVAIIAPLGWMIGSFVAMFVSEATGLGAIWLTSLSLFLGFRRECYSPNHVPSFRQTAKVITRVAHRSRDFLIR